MLDQGPINLKCVCCRALIETALKKSLLLTVILNPRMKTVWLGTPRRTLLPETGFDIS